MKLGGRVRCARCHVRKTFAGFEVCEPCRNADRLVALGARRREDGVIICVTCPAKLSTRSRSPRCRSCGRRAAVKRAGLQLKDASGALTYDPGPEVLEALERRFAWLKATRRYRRGPTLTAGDVWAKHGDPMATAPEWGW